MYKSTIIFAILAVANAGYLQGNNQGAIVEESFAASLAPAAIPAPIYGPPLRASAPYSFAAVSAPASIAFPAPSYAAPIVKTPAYAAPIGLPAPIYGPPAQYFRPSLAVAAAPAASYFRPSLAVAAAPAPYYGAPAALPINSGYSSW